MKNRSLLSAGLFLKLLHPKSVDELSSLEFNPGKGIPTLQTPPAPPEAHQQAEKFKTQLGLKPRDYDVGCGYPKQQLNCCIKSTSLKIFLIDA